MQQLPLFESEISLDSRFWRGSFNGKESKIQQLSPYVGKLKSGMVQVLLSLYSQPGDIILDPFAGSGVVPFEAALAGRTAWASDLSPYAYVLTRAKLEAPATKAEALSQAHEILQLVDEQARDIDLDHIPDWVSDFFHPRTLQEVISAFQILKAHQNHFLTACLLGILHHVRPGFLSYPASHLVPYLRTEKYPPDEFPEMYQYRDLQSRLLAKIQRAYSRHLLPDNWNERQYKVWQSNAMDLSIEDLSVDSIISSPPYFGALDYARDNRLRLWFLGCANWKELDTELTASNKVYVPQMTHCLREMERVLKPRGYCVLVLGDVKRQNGETRRTAEILANIASEGRFEVETIYDDIIPDNRRSRRKTNTTKFERILVLRKR
jgi:DNA modification methylase